MLLAEVSLREGVRDDRFPFDLPLVRHFEGLTFEAPVTLLVGENGSGKSTLLEALAWAAELPVAGSSRLDEDDTLQAAALLGAALELAWSRRSHRGFFLRAEDFFGFVKAQNRSKRELRAELERIEREGAHLPEAERRRIGAPFRGSIGATEARYGRDLDALSHGESFLAFFKGRIVPDGLYLLDEPEAALSPLRQLALLALLKEAVARGGQFVIATHAPVLMAFPGATLLQFEEGRMVRRRFDELEHVTLLRAFLDDPEAFVRHL